MQGIGVRRAKVEDPLSDGFIIGSRSVNMFHRCLEIVPR